jgi:hypothetical protein
MFVVREDVRSSGFSVGVHGVKYKLPHHSHLRDRGPLKAMVRMVEGRPAGGATSNDPRTPGSRSEPYPGHSKGLPYEPTTERDMYWRPEVAQEPASQVPASSEYDCGIGINLVFDQGLKTLVVDGVVPGGPAARSGLVHAGDIVAEVDGINVAGQPLDIVDSLLRGVSVAPHPSELHSPPCRACCLAAVCGSVHGLKNVMSSMSSLRQGSVTRMVLMREVEVDGTFDNDAHAEVREIAITLVRELGFSGRDIIKPKRTGVGITFETVRVAHSFVSPRGTAPAERESRRRPTLCSWSVRGAARSVNPHHTMTRASDGVALALLCVALALLWLAGPYRQCSENQVGHSRLSS